MKVLIYLEHPNTLSISGIGRAYKQQQEALKMNGVEVTTSTKDSFDIAHINSYQLRSYLLMRKLQKKGYKVIVHAHSTKEDLKNSFRMIFLLQPFYNLMLENMYKKADLLLTPTNYSKSLIEKYKGVKKNNVPIIPISNGLKLDNYKHDENKIKMFKEKFSIKEGEKVVIGVGFYFKRKGIDDFIEVARHFKDVKFIWFGYLNKILTSSYINKCIKNKPDNVILPGYIKGDIILGAYQYASCMFFPSNEETEGIVTLEALASHCPLVVRDIGVFKDWLEDGINCYKGKTNDDFIKIISNLLLNTNNTITNNGYETVKNKDLKIIGQKLKEIYLNLLETKN